LNSAVISITAFFCDKLHNPCSNYRSSQLSHLVTRITVYVCISILNKEQHKNYWVTEHMEFSNSNETAYYVTIENTAYYVTIENADTRIVLKSSYNSWIVFNKTIK
jgi:arginine/lysine/ornithine decarboxylase